MEVVIFIYALILGINVVYYLIFSVAGHFRFSEKRSIGNQHRIMVYIPAYKEDAVIVDSARKSLLQNYPKSHYDICVIADGLKKTTLTQLASLPVYVHPVVFKKSSKAKALNSALSKFGGQYEIAVVLDADNVMDNNFLRTVNEIYSAGSLAIQGRRMAKNSNNNLAVLDGISEGINNHIFRKAHVNLGLSSALIGSGMAFDHELFKDQMSRVNALGGFDKQLEVNLMSDGVKIAYSEEAKVLDEKVDNRESFTKQRTRWISAQIRFGFRTIFKSLALLLTRGNIDVFNKSFQFLLIPRLILLGLVGIGAFVGIFTSWWKVFLMLFIANVFSLMLSVPRSMYDIRLIQSLSRLPILFVDMVLAAINFRKANKNFLHTTHRNHS